MSYRVYTKDLDGKHLLASGVSYRETEAYRECCRNVIIEDEANDPIDLPDDAELSELYGVNSRQCLESAAALSLCFGMLVVIGGGIFLFKLLTDALQ